MMWRYIQLRFYYLRLYGNLWWCVFWIHSKLMTATATVQQPRPAATRPSSRTLPLTLALPPRAPLVQKSRPIATRPSSRTLFWPEKLLNIFHTVICKFVKFDSFHEDLESLLNLSMTWNVIYKLFNIQRQSMSYTTLTLVSKRSNRYNTEWFSLQLYVIQFGEIRKLHVASF